MAPPPARPDPELVETIRRFRTLSPEEKLRLLEAWQRFVELATPPKAKRSRQKLRERS